MWFLACRWVANLLQSLLVGKSVLPCGEEMSMVSQSPYKKMSVRVRVRTGKCPIPDTGGVRKLSWRGSSVLLITGNQGMSEAQNYSCMITGLLNYWRAAARDSSANSTDSLFPVGIVQVHDSSGTIS